MRKLITNWKTFLIHTVQLNFKSTQHFSQTINQQTWLRLSSRSLSYSQIFACSSAMSQLHCFSFSSTDDNDD